MDTTLDRPMGELAVLDRSGDTKQIWDPEKPEEVEAARVLFNTLKKKGYMAYKVTGKGDKGEVIREFDPDAGKIIMSPQVVGG